MKKIKRGFNVQVDLDRDLRPRPGKVEDANFIINSWLKSYRDSEFAVAIPNEIYYPHHENMIKHILLQDTNSVTVLCDPDDEDHIIAYAVYNTKFPAMFYLYVKHAFRNLGIGRYLFESIRKEYGHNVKMHCTHKMRSWKKFKSLGLVFNPYLIREPAECPELEQSASTKE